MLAIPAAYLLAKELLDELRAGIAAVIFAAMPVAWAIEGGGVTRALAFALLLLALWRVAVLLRAPTLGRATMVGILGGAAVLTHPAVGPAGLAIAALLFAFRPSRRGLVALGGSGLLAGVLVAPWLAITLIRYGSESVITAAASHATESAIGRLLTFGPSWIGTLDFVLPLGLVGMAIVAHRREWLLPVWVSLMLVVPGGEGRYAAVAWAMLAATGAVLIGQRMAADGALKLAAGIGFAWLFLASLGAGYQSFSAIPGGVREAMAAAGRDVPETARFAVVTDSGRLEHSVLDWFPTLSGRVSIGTFMGLEWTTAENWEHVVALSHRIARGEIPAGADYVFTAVGGSATWAPAR
jgi:4-amino-4-deoxy-L-arabinose transferase-like glycosyltransferase